MKKQVIAILGSTGSIGTQTLDVVQQNPDKFEIYALTANNNIDLLIAQTKQFHPDTVVVANEEKYEALQNALKDFPVKVFCGEDSLCDVVSAQPVTTVVTATVGFSGLRPTIAAIKAGKRIALANKETLVVAGELITRLVAENHVEVVPVDSEHGAIFQCLVGEDPATLERVVLTASGGPFRSKTMEELHHVKAKDALKHPTWTMGAKITIDSASLMNKGFEVIEARWLFDLKPEQIDVVVHPQSVIHSMVEFKDSSMKAQMGWPDMRLPIQFALTFPERCAMTLPRLDFSKCTHLTFERPDMERFPNLSLAFRAMNQGGNMPCVLNAANEVVVASFLEDEIGFLEMSDIIKEVMDVAAFIASPTLDDYIACDQTVRLQTRAIINNRKTL